jgi:hypothetical protein
VEWSSDCYWFCVLQVLAKQAEWAAAGVDDHASSCKDFMQQLAYREYSRCGDSVTAVGWLRCCSMLPVTLLLQSAGDSAAAVYRIGSSQVTRSCMR